jgi:hypothetical protein
VRFSWQRTPGSSDREIRRKVAETEREGSIWQSCAVAGHCHWMTPSHAASVKEPNGSFHIVHLLLSRKLRPERTLEGEVFSENMLTLRTVSRDWHYCSPCRPIASAQPSVLKIGGTYQCG